MQDPDPAKPNDEDSSSDYLIFGLLREIRAAAQYLQNLLVKNRDFAAQLDGAGRTEVMARTLSPTVLERINARIVTSLQSIRDLFMVDYGQFKWCSDEVEIIRLNWLEVLDFWPEATASFDEQSRGLNHAIDCLDQIIYECASLTLASRARETLENLRVGQPLDWDFAFSREMPMNLELRKRLLEELAQEGGVLATGVVDVDQRVIYKVAKTRAEQTRSTWKLAAIVLLSGLLVPLALSRIGTLISQWPHTPADLRRLYVTYVLVFIGSGAHVAIDALKVARTQTRPSFQAITDWILWIHVRYTRIVFSLMWVLLGYVLLSILMPKLELVSAFFAGYSIDSVTALFISRFEATVTVKTQELTGDTSKPKPSAPPKYHRALVKG